MYTPKVKFFVKSTKLSRSEGLTNSVLIIFDAKSVEILEIPTTGERNQLSTCPRWLYIRLAAEIAREAKNSGFGRNGFHLIIDVKITYVVVISDPQTSNNEASSKSLSLFRMLRIGKTDREELKMETEPCSICLENLSGSKRGRATRMACSHVFHDSCLLEWLERKNTCPLCRTMLYDR